MNQRSTFAAHLGHSTKGTATTQLVAVQRSARMGSTTDLWRRSLMAALLTICAFASGDLRGQEPLGPDRDDLFGPSTGESGPAQDTSTTNRLENVPPPNDSDPSNDSDSDGLASEEKLDTSSVDPDDSLEAPMPMAPPPQDIGNNLEKPGQIQPPTFDPAKQSQSLAELQSQQFRKAYWIEANGPIFGRFHWYLNHRIDEARRQGADLVIIQLTSPGGDLEYSLQLARKIRDIDFAKTIVWIPEEAISGGALISLGADAIFMKRSALFGDAGPIVLGPNGQFQFAEEKIVSYLTTAIREIAKAKNRPAAVAEAMADRSLVVFSATDRQNNQATFLTKAQIATPEIRKLYEIGDPIQETGQDRFLTLDADRAQALFLCNQVFQSEEDMVASLNVGEMHRTRLNWVDKTVYGLNHPAVTALLLIAGLIGIYLEVLAPGLSVAGLTSMLCFGLFFWSHMLGGTAGWLEVLLFTLGIICVLCEVFILPGFGVFGISGVGLIAIALIMASQGFLVPANSLQWDQLKFNSLVVLGALAGVATLLLVQILALDSLPGLKRFQLQAPEYSLGGEAATPPTAAPQRPPIGLGATGIATSDLRPSGKVTIEQTLVDVLTEGDYVEAGTPVEVVRIEGNRVTVRRL